MIDFTADMAREITDKAKEELYVLKTQVETRLKDMASRGHCKMRLVNIPEIYLNDILTDLEQAGYTITLEVERSSNTWIEW